MQGGTRMTLATIGGDAFQDDVQEALDKVADSYNDPSLDKEPRKITIEVIFKKANDRYMKVEAKANLKLPRKSYGTIAWCRENTQQVGTFHLMTEETDDSRQIEIPGTRPTPPNGGHTRPARSEEN